MLHTAGGVTIPSIRLWAELLLTCEGDQQRGFLCLVDSGVPISVIPHNVWQQRKLTWQPLSGPWPSGLLSWLGAPCVLGQAEVWLPLPEWPFLRGPFPFVAKFAQATPPGLVGPPPVLLSLNFLADHRADVSFQCHTPPRAGTIVLP